MRPGVLLFLCASFVIGYFNVVYANASAELLVRELYTEIQPTPKMTELERAEYFPTAEQVNTARVHVKFVGIMYG